MDILQTRKRANLINFPNQNTQTNYTHSCQIKARNCTVGDLTLFFNYGNYKEIDELN